MKVNKNTTDTKKALDELVKTATLGIENARTNLDALDALTSFRASVDAVVESSMDQYEAMRLAEKAAEEVVHDLVTPPEW